MAKAFADEGAKVAICSHDIGKIEAAAKKIQGSLPFVCDLEKSGEGTRLVKDVKSRLGGLDVLVTNSGGPPKGHFSALKMEDWEKGFRGLWMGPLECIYEALPSMKEQKWGRIILSTSTSAKEPIAGLTISNAMRAGLLGLMKTLSIEVASSHVTVNAILPGYTDTEHLASLKIPDSVFNQLIPMHRLGRPDELASLALFLGSEVAAYITGQAIACDGGALRGL
jgi:3-oxoacyl-[acyl-carrier protein] reductase